MNRAFSRPLCPNLRFCFARVHVLGPRAWGDDLIVVLFEFLDDDTKLAQSCTDEPVDPGVAEVDPAVLLDLDIDLLLQNLRNSRRGAAGGPSGMTTEHLKILLESATGSSLLGEAATMFARGRIPEEILIAVRVGRMTALQKADGGIRGIVVGDVFRRLVARTIAKQFAEQAEGATHPLQYALSTRAGTECVAHIVQAITSMDENATLLSTDGVGAYDSISRRAMFRGLADMVDGEKIIPS